MVRQKPYNKFVYLGLSKKIHMLQVGDRFPEFKVMANTKLADVETAFDTITSECLDGKWTVMFFWPLDFTFVCPTEMSEMGDLNSQFEESNAQVFGVSVDSHFSHLAWRKIDKRIEKLPFPLLSDFKREISTSLGIIDHETGAAQRTTVIIDPKRSIRFLCVTDLSVGRNSFETLRVLHALQHGGLCPANWKKGEETL